MMNSETNLNFPVAQNNLDETINPNWKPESDAELMNLKPGMELAQKKYCLVQEAGQGGMGVVWKAKDTIADRDVALKFVPPQIRHIEKTMKQVQSAFKVVQDLNHSCICPMYGIEQDPAFGFFIVMKWMDGETLDDWFVRVCPHGTGLPLEQVLPILEKLASALDYAHSQKVIHRDVKPSNIFLTTTPAGELQSLSLIDFGLASRIRATLSTVSGTATPHGGTAFYMPPEQWEDQQQDGRTDQYALACVAYELLSGQVPFHNSDLRILRLRVLDAVPSPLPNVSHAVNRALLRALSKAPASRFPSCAAFVSAISAVPTPSVFRRFLIPTLLLLGGLSLGLATVSLLQHTESLNEASAPAHSPDLHQKQDQDQNPYQKQDQDQNPYQKQDQDQNPYQKQKQDQNPYQKYPR